MKSLVKNLAVGALMLGVATSAAVSAKAQEISIIAVTHGQASDPFWSIVKNGMMQAAEDSNVHVD